MEHFNAKKILKSHSSGGIRLSVRESNWLEFKESFNWNSKDRYGKTLAGFANNRGGYIVFGVSNNPYELVGLQSTNFEKTDEAKIAGYLNSTFAPEISFEKYVLKYRQKYIGILHVNKAIHRPIISLKNDDTVKESDIYYRYNARTDRIKHAELQAIIDWEREKIDEKWRELLRNIGKIPDISQAAAISHDSATQVKITDDPTAPAVRVAEDPTVGGFNLRYRDVTSGFRKEMPGIKLNKRFNTAMKKLKQDETLCRKRHLDPSNPKSATQHFYHPNILTELKKAMR